MFKGDVPVWAVYAFGAYFFAFIIDTGGVFLWRTARRKERPPEKFKLLRAPGETLRRRVQHADENFFWYFFSGAFAPLFLAWGVLVVTVRLPRHLVLAGVAVALLSLIAGLILAAVLLLRFMRRRRSDFLGYLGERAVAESLESLREEGCRLFHDVPAEGRSKNFNLDHVVVGPTGVTVVETKTRRKKKGRPGSDDHVVSCDGTRLIWPWGEETSNIDQVVAQADWLRKWIEKRTALRVDPKPGLAIPGWFVKERAVGPFRVANQKMLARIITQWKPQSLSAEQIDLICRQLDERCRDVED
jgi:hypothetical protein